MTDFDYKSEIFARQRTAEGLAFEKYYKRLKRIATEPRNEAERDAVNRANEELLKVKFLGPNDVHVDTTMENLSIMYKNDEYIGERLMPVVTADKKSNVYFKYDPRDMLRVPDDKLGPRGKANEVDFALSEDNYKAEPYGLEGYVDLETVDNADMPLDPMLDTQLHILNGMGLNREIRIATILQNASNYGGNTLAIGAGAEWDSANGGDPAKVIQDAVDSLYRGMTPTRRIGFCGLKVYRTLSRHPAIRDLFKAADGGRPGFASKEQIANYFELDELLVGAARYDTANRKATENIQRIWGNVFGVLEVATAPAKRSMSFGLTLRNGQVRSVQEFKPRLGVAGGILMKTTVSEDHKVVVPKAGFLITGCLVP